MRNPKRVVQNKRLIILVIAMIAIAFTAFTTAWLNDTDATQTNVFVSGKDLTISFDETMGNGELIVPGDKVAKDPTVTVEADSEPCYLFVKAKESADAADFLDYNIGTDFLPMSEFVVDGKLDPKYKTNTYFYFDSANDTYDDYVTAYYSHKNTTEFTGTIDSHIKMWVAYDSASVYVYFKMYTPYTSATVRMYYDPDPVASDSLSFADAVGSIDHGDAAFRVDYSGNIANQSAAIPSDKGPYYNAEYFRNKSNLVHFNFSDSTGSGYGFEVRLPRKDDESGTFKLNFAAETNHGDNDTMFGWSFGPAWSNWRSSMHTFDFKDTFVTQNYDGYYYRIVGDVKDGRLDADQTFYILQGLTDNDRNGNSMANGYVQFRSQKQNGNDIVNSDVANCNVTLTFKAVAIQQQNLVFTEAFKAAKPELDS